MVKKSAVLAPGVALLLMGLSGPAQASKPTTMKGCMACHTAAPDVVRGKLVSHSAKFGTVQVDVGPVVWVIKYGRDTKLEGAESLAGVAKGKEMAVTFAGAEKDPVATAVSIKKPFELPEEMQVSVEEMQRLAARGPAKGGFLLVDSRPPGAFASGHLPGAVNIPYSMLNSRREAVLPREKDAQVILYCGGFA